MSWIENVSPYLLHISAAVCPEKTYLLIQRDPAIGQCHHEPTLCMAQVFIGYTVSFSTCDNIEQPRIPCRVLLPFQQHGLSQKIPVQHKQGPADEPRGTEAVAEHLHHMGYGFIPEPVADSSVPIMNLDG